MGTSPLDEVEVETQQHQSAVSRYERANKRYAELARREGEMEAERHEVKAKVCARLMKDGGLAFTPAEKQATTDPEYLGHLAAQRQVVYDKELAFGEARVALSQADLAIARLKALAGVR